MDRLSDKINSDKNRLSQLQRELKENSEISKGLNKRRHELTNSIKSLEKNLAKFLPSELKVSDHAIVRYLERMHDLDLESLKDDITECIGDGFKGNAIYRGFVVKDNVVVTFKGNKNA